MRPIPVRTILVAAALLAPAARAGAQITVSQNSGCPGVEVSAARDGAIPDSGLSRDSTLRGSEAAGRPDIVLLVAFSADELRFNSQPNARIRFCWGSDSLHIVERRNLPSPVVAGTTYRNVFIAAELRAYLNAECLARQLGVSSSVPPAQSNSSCPALRLDAVRGSAKAGPAGGATSAPGTSR